jgi:hypothetical protein
VPVQAAATRGRGGCRRWRPCESAMS